MICGFLLMAIGARLLFKHDSSGTSFLVVGLLLSGLAYFFQRSAKYWFFVNHSMHSMNTKLSMADRAALNAVAEKYNLDEPMTLHHTLYIPDNFNAKQVANTLRREGYAAGVGMSAYQGSGINRRESPYWLVVAEKEAYDIIEELPDIRQLMEKLAEKNQGEYGGWEVVK